MLRQVVEKGGDVGLFESFLGHLGGDVSLGYFLAKKISDFGVCE
jgi:hypothetical protein